MRRRALAGWVLAAPLSVPAWAQAVAQTLTQAPQEPPRARTSSMVALMGKRLFGPDGEELGRLVDLVADAEGRPVAAVVDVGGFMGLGSRRVALAWGLLRFRAMGDRVRMSIALPPEQVTAAPEYRPGEPSTIFNPPASE